MIFYCSRVTNKGCNAADQPVQKVQSYSTLKTMIAWMGTTVGYGVTSDTFELNQCVHTGYIWTR